MATFTGQAGTTNTFVGTATADLFRFAATDINARDTVTGGGGTDRLQLTTAGILLGTALNGVKGVEEIALADGTNGIKLINANFTGITGGKIAVFGGRGNDRVDASTLTGTNAIDVAAGAGLDVFLGGAGADTFRFAAAGLAGDTVVGGGGRDLLVLTSAGAVSAVQMAGVAGVEMIQLAPGGNIITLGNANFAGVAGARIAVKIGAGNSSVVGEGLTGANAIDVTGGEGMDVITGGAGRDTFRFRQADLNGDTVRGSGGADLLLLTTGGALGAGALASVEAVETIRLAATGNTITLVNSNFDGVGGAQIRVLGGAGNDGVDGSALTGLNRIDVTAGAGNDVLKGGARADVFRFRALDLTSADRVIGGAGRDTLLLTTAGTITLAGVSGVETIRLANGTNALRLGNATVAEGAAITVIGGSGNDTVDGSGLTGVRSIEVTAGAGLDVLKGTVRDDLFLFRAADLAGDSVVGGGGFDRLQLTTAGLLEPGTLANVQGIEEIILASGGNQITLTNANFVGLPPAQLEITGSSGPSVVDAADVTMADGIRFRDKGGTDTIIGSEGADSVVYERGAVAAAGDTFDGGGGVDEIRFDQSMNFLGDTLTRVELLYKRGSEDANVTISGINAARFTAFGSSDRGDGTTVFTVQLEAGSTTNLANLRLDNPDEGDAINVVSTSGATRVTLSAAIARFTGSADADTVRFAPGGQYKTDVVIDGGEGDDRIAFDGVDQISAEISGGAGRDTLVLTGGATINLAREDQYTSSGSFTSFTFTLITKFEHVDASASTAGVTLTGHDDVFSRLTGGSGTDTITAGVGGARITGGLGADVLTGNALLDNFIIRSTAEARADTIIGGGGTDTIFLRGNTDLTETTIIGIELLSLFATDAVTDLGIARDLTVTLTGAQAEDLQIINGNTTANTVETLVVNHKGGELDLSSLEFLDWRSEDRVVINGTTGADTITGTSQNDVINGGFGADTLSGGGGNDVIGYSQLSTQEMNGGAGTDTIRLDNLAEPGKLTVVRIDLLNGVITEDRADGGSSFVTNAREFENADFSLNTITTDVSGTNGANILIGGSADDGIIGSGGGDTLTGGDGADRFLWSVKEHGNDRITDFTRGEDRLFFYGSAFTFAGKDFDQATFDSGSGTLNLNNTDLLIAGQTLETAADVRVYVNSNSTSTQHGMFVVATTTSGSRVLYYTSNASSSGANNAFFQIADLGEGPAPALNDFLFLNI